MASHTGLGDLFSAQLSFFALSPAGRGLNTNRTARISVASYFPHSEPQFGPLKS